MRVRVRACVRLVCTGQARFTQYITDIEHSLVEAAILDVVLGEVIAADIAVRARGVRVNAAAILETATAGLKRLRDGVRQGDTYFYGRGLQNMVEKQERGFW